MEFSGEKTEQPTLRRLEEASKRGQFPRSAEVQTVVVLGAAMLALMFVGHESWRHIVLTFHGTLGHLHDIPLTFDGMQGYAIQSAWVVGKCVWPIVIAATL